MSAKLVKVFDDRSPLAKLRRRQLEILLMMNGVPFNDGCSAEELRSLVYSAGIHYEGTPIPAYSQQELDSLGYSNKKSIPEMRIKEPEIIVPKNPHDPPAYIPYEARKMADLRKIMFARGQKNCFHMKKTEIVEFLKIQDRENGKNAS